MAAADLTRHLLNRQLESKGLAVHATSRLVPLEAQHVAEWDLDAVWGRWLQPWPAPTCEEWEERQTVSRRAMQILVWLQECHPNAVLDTRPYIRHVLHNIVQYAITGISVIFAVPICLLYGAQASSAFHML